MDDDVIRKKSNERTTILNRLAFRQWQREQHSGDLSWTGPWIQGGNHQGECIEQMKFVRAGLA
jgi:hypothetical protein